MNLPKFDTCNTIEQGEFSVTLRKKHDVTNDFKYSTANAAKPLIYFASLFSVQLIRYFKCGIFKVNYYSKLRCIAMISILVALTVLIKPISWLDTRSDIPLNILTKTYSALALVEVIYSIFIVSFGNSSIYVKLFKKIDEINAQFGTSRRMYCKLRLTSIALIMIPILLVSGTFFLRKFNIINISSHLIYFMLMLQGVLITFFIVQIYLHILILNTLLVNKVAKTISLPKYVIYTKSKYGLILMKIFTDSNTADKQNNNHYCWFQLMQMYDKICDCIFYFNKIYAGQVFIMFNTWFICTLLTICRSLSPSVKYSEVFINDLFMYASINARPIFLAKMCQLLMNERNKTIMILLHNLVHEIDEIYSDQVQSMIDLVIARKIEISTNVFTADVSTVLEFAGRSISYTVLMIQYFYMRVFK